MPKGYAIFTETIRDQAGYDGYVQKAVPTILRSGGRPIVVYDDPEVIEGQWHGRRTVILETRRSSASGMPPRKQTPSSSAATRCRRLASS